MAQLTPPPHLYNEVLDEIRYRQAAAALKRRIFVWAAGLVGSWMAFILFFQDFSDQASHSGFTDLSRLLLSDFGVIKTHLYDYFLSLAEALPIVSLALLALALLIIIGSAIKLLSSAVELKHLRSH